jgi:class 3 adenylate cyclase
VPYREFHYRWEWGLKSSPEAIWPFVSDTNRFNRDAGLPVVTTPTDTATTLANARRHLGFRRFGLAVEWIEEPFEWIRPYRFGVVRRLTRGPVAEMRVVADLKPQPEGGTQLTYQVWVRPRSAAGLIAIPLQIGQLSARKFAAVVRRYDELAAAGEQATMPTAAAHFPTSGRARLRQMSEKLAAQGAQPELVARLVETIEQADDLTLARLRPYALADCWHEPRRAVLELCLWATRAGMLDLRWDMLCPLCRGAKDTAATLAELASNVHCETCNIDFTVNFDRSVELTFCPNPAVRYVEARAFCVGGPQVTPHIVAQQLLAPGASRQLQLPLEPGRYRLRTLQQPGAQALVVTDEGAAELELCANENGWAGDELTLSLQPALTYMNATEAEQLFILERMAWSDQAVTAAEVTALQIFRDLFASEALRPHQQISVGSLTVVFTDLRGSTRLYREIGDAPAFGAVMSHFDVLRECVDEEEGALVKTLGDAIMAVFRRPAGALRAMLKAQHRLSHPPTGARPFQLKVGLHMGHCIAVNLNGRLDYFGSNVNIAARLEPLSDGSDIIISSAVRDDPKVAAMLNEPDSELQIEPIAATLKGLEQESIELWRIRARMKDERN